MKLLRSSGFHQNKKCLSAIKCYTTTFPPFSFSFNPFLSLSFFFFLQKSMALENTWQKCSELKIFKSYKWSILYISPPNMFSHHHLCFVWLVLGFFWFSGFHFFCFFFLTEKYPISVENLCLLSILKEKRPWSIFTLSSALLIVLNHFAPDKKNTKCHSVHISSALSTLKCFR